jgi:hypothetical protein
MKHLVRLSVCGLLFIFFLLSCDDKVSYASLAAKEKDQISNFIKQNNINVVKVIPKDSVWKSNVFFQTESGLYYHQVGSRSKLDTTIGIKYNNVFWPRYRELTLDNPQVEIGNHWTVTDDPNPKSFRLGLNIDSIAAFHEAAELMKYNNAEALLIVPSKIGFQANKQSVKPYYYHIKLRFTP